jgi:hypothetical protein
MTDDEEKIAETECALDGQPGLIADARRGFQDVFETRFFNFKNGCGTSSRTWNTERHYTEELERVVGNAAMNAIYDEEWLKFESAEQQTCPEVWQVYAHGTEEEQDSFPVQATEEALAEWIEERKHQKNRDDYAQKFYGVKP